MKTHEAKSSLRRNTERALAVGTLSLLATTGCASGGSGNSETTPAPRPAIDRLLVPAGHVALKPVDCSFGQPIPPQKPKWYHNKWYAAIDGRCNPPSPDAPVGVYDHPQQESPAPHIVYNGYRFGLECQTKGQRIGDERGLSSDEWVGVAVPGRTPNAMPSQGLIPLVNFGGLSLDKLGLRACLNG
jgi:hypothetical protein